MANDELGLSTPTSAPAQGSQPLNQAPPPSQTARQPRLDAGVHDTSTDYGTHSDSGPQLAPPALPQSMVSLTTSLYIVMEKISSTRAKHAKDQIKEHTADAQAADKKRIDALDKMIKAKEKAKHHSKIGKIFGWIGVALTYVAAAVVTVASGGLAAAPLFAAAIAMTTVMVMQETGGMDKLAQALHLDKKGEMGLMIGITAAILVVSLVSVVASGGAAAASLVSSIASAASRFAATGAEVGATAADMTAAGTEAGVATAEITSDTAEGVSASTEMAGESADISSTTADTSAEATESTSELSESTEASSATTQSTESTSASSQSTSTTSEADSEATSSEAEDQIAENSASKTQKVAARVGNVVNLAAGGASIGGGVSGIQTSEAQHDASMAEADSTEQQATIQQIQVMQAAIIKKLQRILEAMQQNTSAIISMAMASNETAEALINKTTAA